MLCCRCRSIGPFTYKLKDDNGPPVGGRVVVPFRNEKLIGVVTRLHDEAPPVEARPIEAVLDQEPILSAELMELAAWIAQYYLAPLGEVLRSMPSAYGGSAALDQLSHQRKPA